MINFVSSSSEKKAETANEVVKPLWQQLAEQEQMKEEMIREANRLNKGPNVLNEDDVAFLESEFERRKELERLRNINVQQELLKFNLKKLSDKKPNDKVKLFSAEDEPKKLNAVNAKPVLVVVKKRKVSEISEEKAKSCDEIKPSIPSVLCNYSDSDSESN